MRDKTDFLTALRPFSLIVATATCGLGASLALLDGVNNIPLAGLVIFAGILLQIAVNLINDHRDLKDKTLSLPQQKAIRCNTRIGFGFMLTAIVLGFYMVSLRGWPLLLLGVIGVLGAWGYTGGIINYKARGLGIPLVFLLMGILLIGGSYYVVAGSYQWSVLWLSIPFSLLSSLLLLSNELRDFEQDSSDGVQTLCVRLGYNMGIKLYYALVISLYFVSVLLYLVGLLNGVITLMLSAFALIQPLKLLNRPQPERRRLTLLTGRFYFIYSSLFIATIWQPLP